VVIPREIRERLGLEEGTGLLVFRVGDSIILKTTSEVTAGRSASSLQAIRRKIAERRITRKDVTSEVRAARKRRQKTRA